MSGFLQGLRDMLFGSDGPAPGAVVNAQLMAPEPDDPSAYPSSELNNPQPQAAAPQHQQGLLSKLGHWAISPEGLMAIGTTLRAGTGDENAFTDQARFMQNLQQQSQLAKKRASMKAMNAAVLGALETDSTTGRQKVNHQKLNDSLKALAEPVDLGEVKQSIDALSSTPYDIVAGPRGITAIDRENLSHQNIQKYAQAPIAIKLPNGKTGYIQPDDEDTPAAPAASVAPIAPPAAGPTQSPGLPSAPRLVRAAASPRGRSPGGA